MPKGDKNYRFMKNTAEFISDARALHGDKYDYSRTEYMGAHVSVTVGCLQHGEFWITPSNHTKKHRNENCNPSGCPTCGKEAVTYRNRSRTLSWEEYLAKARVVHSDRYSYIGDYCGYRNPITVLCDKHGSFLSNAGNHLKGTGCPLCKNSKGEQIIQTHLENKLVNYIREHTFSDCLSPYGIPYRFDFYLPEYNLIIEYDGEQHFKPVKFSSKITTQRAEERLAKVQEYDRHKNVYAEAKNIRMERISYKEIRQSNAILTNMLT